MLGCVWPLPRGIVPACCCPEPQSAGPGPAAAGSTAAHRPLCAVWGVGGGEAKRRGVGQQTAEGAAAVAGWGVPLNIISLTM